MLDRGPPTCDDVIQAKSVLAVWCVTESNCTKFSTNSTNTFQNEEQRVRILLLFETVENETQYPDVSHEKYQVVFIIISMTSH